MHLRYARSRTTVAVADVLTPSEGDGLLIVVDSGQGTSLSALSSLLIFVVVGDDDVDDGVVERRGQDARYQIPE